MAPHFKLIYFPLAGRGEVARLMFTLGNIKFEDKRISFEEWHSGDLKSQMPFGQMPVLEVDGKKLAQMAAIDHYVARLAGMMPDDPWEAALADQAYFFWEDVWAPIAPTFKIEDAEARLKARQEVAAGPLADKLKMMTKLVESRPGKYLSGDQLTYADLATFTQLSTLRSGWLEGIPTNILDDYPALQDFRDSIASLPEIAVFYSKEDDEFRKRGFTA